MTRLRTKHDMPRYMEDEAIVISGQILFQLWKQAPKRYKQSIHTWEAVPVAQRRDGSWWLKYTPHTVIWAWRWWEIPKTIGKRIDKLDSFIKEELS